MQEELGMNALAFLQLLPLLALRPLFQCIRVVARIPLIMRFTCCSWANASRDMSIDTRFSSLHEHDTNPDARIAPGRND